MKTHFQNKKRKGITKITIYRLNKIIIKEKNNRIVILKINKNKILENKYIVKKVVEEKNKELVDL